MRRRFLLSVFFKALAAEVNYSSRCDRGAGTPRAELAERNDLTDGVAGGGSGVGGEFGFEQRAHDTKAAGSQQEGESGRVADQTEEAVRDAERMSGF